MRKLASFVACLGLALLLGAASSHSVAPSREPCVLPGERPESLNRTSALDREREARAITRAQGRVSRRGDTLGLRLANGRYRTFVDCTDSWERYARYTFEALGPRGLGYITWISAGEPTNFFWHDPESDTSVILHSFPEYNRDSSRMIVANDDQGSGNSANIVEVFAVRGPSLVREFSFEDRRGGFSFGAFESDTVVRLYRIRQHADRDADSTPALLVRTRGTWRLDSRALNSRGDR